MPISSVGYNEIPYHSVFAPPSLNFIVIFLFVRLFLKKRLAGSFYDTSKTQSQIKA